MPETPSAGATPAAAGATPTQTTPVSPAPATPATTPATGAPDVLGEGGMRALEAERTKAAEADRRAKAAEKELADLKAASLTDAEKAIAQAKKDGAAEVHGRMAERIRGSEVRAALTAAGISPAVLDLAIKADEFAKLKVTEDGDVEGLDGAVKAFKGARADLFTKAPTPKPGDAGLGPRGTAPQAGTDLNTWIRREAGRA